MSLGPINDRSLAHAFTGDKIVCGKGCHLREEETPAKKSRVTYPAMWAQMTLSNKSQMTTQAKLWANVASEEVASYISRQSGGQ